MGLNWPSADTILQVQSKEDTMTQTTAGRQSIANPLIAELKREAQITRRVLEGVPQDKLSWRPHPKSMSLGQPALHVATTPGGVSRILINDSYEVGTFTQPEVASTA
jgi:hypothetical protein